MKKDFQTYSASKTISRFEDCYTRTVLDQELRTSQASQTSANYCNVRFSIHIRCSEVFVDWFFVPLNMMPACRS